MCRGFEALLSTLRESRVLAVLMLCMSCRMLHGVLNQGGKKEGRNLSFCAGCALFSFLLNWHLSRFPWGVEAYDTKWLQEKNTNSTRLEAHCTHK